MVDELTKDKNKRFTFPGVQYLQMWYKRQDKSQQSKMKELIKSGQFEVVNGGLMQIE